MTIFFTLRPSDFIKVVIKENLKIIHNLDHFDQTIKINLPWMCTQSTLKLILFLKWPYYENIINNFKVELVCTYLIQDTHYHFFRKSFLQTTIIIHKSIQ